MKKEIIFFLTHKYNNQISNNIDKINREKGDRDFCVLMHSDKNSKGHSLPLYSFSFKQLSTLNFRMLKENRLVPGSAHLPIFYYFKKLPDYKYYWVIEYDVEFGGNWKYLFNTYQSSSADFVSSYITHFKNDERWPWWYLTHPVKSISNSERIRSFNPIYRISRRALHYLHDELRTGWKGHNEVLLSTLLYHNDFELLDFGRGGEFSSELFPNFYTKNFQFHTRKLFPLRKFYYMGTMRYRPAMKKRGNRNLLYHPIKTDSGLTRFGEMIYLTGLLGRRILKPFSRNSSRYSITEHELRS